MNDTSGFDIDENRFSDTGLTVIRTVHESESGFCRILEIKRGGRLYIAKCLKPEYRKSPAHIELLRREYDILSSLYHPSIIQAFGIENLPDIGPAIILEYAHGVTLQTYIASGEVTDKIARDILEQICEAIDYCHRRDIIHRDLKPSNIMIFPQGPIIKLIDFNFSYSPSFTDPPLPGGTTGFSAPEQFDSDTSTLPSSDIWSIGKIMEVLFPKGGSRWRRVARQCMSPDPKNRPASAKKIPLLLKKKILPKKQIILSVLALTALIPGGIWLLSDKKKTDKITVTDNSDYIISSDSLSATPKEDNQSDSTYPDLPSSEESNISENQSTSSILLPDIKTNTGTKEVSTSTDNLQIILPENILSETKRRAQQAASHRFKEQLAILDTAVSPMPIALAKAGHWRWLAKQDMAKWIKTQNLSADEEKRITKEVEVIVKEFDRSHHDEFKKAMQDAFIKRRVIWVMNAPETLKTYIGDGEYEYSVLGEDGVWHKKIVKKSEME